MNKDVELHGNNRYLAAWNRFWFQPADPTLLGLIRICCGAITFYSMLVYSFRFQDLMGPAAWEDLPARLKQISDEPRDVTPLNWPSVDLRTEKDEAKLSEKERRERAYARAYFQKWAVLPPPPPYPDSDAEQRFIDDFIADTGADPRAYGAKTPISPAEKQYLFWYFKEFKRPPPAYPDFLDDRAELERHKQYLREYFDVYGRDPRSTYASGIPVWSIWFDITDPAGMALVHGLVVLITFLFMIGFCTRITSALTWMFCLWYIHRSNVVLFGVDTMQTILLLYLMIGPSGAALSVDRLIARWWSKSKPRVINRWRALWKQPALDPREIAPASYTATPAPVASANVAYRLIQIHTCIVYAMAGLAKLQGSAWWQGTAVWGTLANFEFAPMQYSLYLWFLRQIAAVQWIFFLFLTAAGYFTLVFEICYAFLIWRPTTRWWILGGAILLHGFIGLFMGLKTFSMMMLVMNMAFLTNQEARWFLRLVGGTKPPEPRPKSASPSEETPRHSPSVAVTAIK